MKNKLSKLINNKINNLGYKDYINKAQKKINRLNYKYNKTSEANADKNISKYLKQIGIPKNERRAHYYLYRDTGRRNNITNNRYGGRFGNLKYLKDYIFGFSRLPDEYCLDKPEWENTMRQYFFNILRRR